MADPIKLERCGAGSRTLHENSWDPNLGCSLRSNYVNLTFPDSVHLFKNKFCAFVGITTATWAHLWSWSTTRDRYSSGSQSFLACCQTPKLANSIFPAFKEFLNIFEIFSVGAVENTCPVFTWQSDDFSNNSSVDGQTNFLLLKEKDAKDDTGVLHALSTVSVLLKSCWIHHSPGPGTRFLESCSSHFSYLSTYYRSMSILEVVFYQLKQR